MQADEIKTAIKLKTQEFETALELGKPNTELLEIYKELKELQYTLIKTEHSLEPI
jgi:hypothetical protein